MASPVVAGTAALIMAYYPNLSAQQVRSIIMENVVSYGPQSVVVPANPNETQQTKAFRSLSVSDGVVNVYRALQAAEEMSP